jgi:hypothetical protein
MATESISNLSKQIRVMKYFGFAFAILMIEPTEVILDT